MKQLVLVKMDVFTNIEDSEWNCSLGGHAQMLRALKKGLANAEHCAMQKARKVKSPLHPPFDCHMLPKRQSPLQECKYQDFGYSLHLLPSRRFFNSLSTHPHLLHQEFVYVPPSDSHIFLPYNCSHFSCVLANILFFCKPKFF